MTELEPLAAELRKQLGSPPEQWLREQRARLRETLRAPPRSRRSKSWWVAAGVAAACALLLVARFASAPRPSPSPSDSSVWLGANTLPSPYRLPDGSTIELSAASEGQLSLHQDRVHFDLRRGKALFDVKTRPERDFVIVSGRYEVRVIGTRFSVEHGPADDCLIEVERGLVSVRVPEQLAAISLRAGDRFSGKSDRVSVQRNPSVSSTSSPPLAAASTPVPLASETRALQPVPPEPAAADWQQLYRAERYQHALAAAKKHGLDALVAGLKVDALAELADTARLAGDSLAAVRALNALERRFPGSKAAASAPFLLGRAHSSRGERDAAITAFERYLQSNARAAYANEARGRLIGLYDARGDRQKAVAIARDYLASAPAGPYRRQAESLIAH